MVLARWDPFGDLMTLRQAMERLFEDAWVLPSRIFRAGTGYFPVEVAEREDHFTVKAVLPGIAPENLDVSVSGNLLTIRGELKQPEAEKQATWHYREIPYGRFERRITLPAEVQVDQAEAIYEHGILTLRLPKAEAAKPKRIQVAARQPALAGSAS